MKLPRPPDWLIYLGVVAALAVLAVFVGEHTEAPPAPRPPRADAGAPLAPASLFDPAILVTAPTTSGGAGTAFSVSDSGVWLTARHVVDGCARSVIVTAPGRGVAAQVRLTPGRETAILITQGGAPALPIAPMGPLHRGKRAFHPGFPQSRAGAVASELLARNRLFVRGWGFRTEPVLAWAEVGRTSGLRGSLAGISGAPALDSAGRVVGVTLAESPRRRRLYTTTPSSLRAALAAASVTPQTAARGEVFGRDNYDRLADSLRHDLRITQVVCLAR